MKLRTAAAITRVNEPSPCHRHRVPGGISFLFRRLICGLFPKARTASTNAGTKGTNCESLSRGIGILPECPVLLKGSSKHVLELSTRSTNRRHRRTPWFSTCLAGPRMAHVWPIYGQPTNGSARFVKVAQTEADALP